MGTSAPQACWTIVGIGIRLAQDVGAHRRKAYGHKPTVEEELWKRAFWYVRIIRGCTLRLNVLSQGSYLPGPIGEFIVGTTMCDTG
jgi:hypothetical protein